MKKEWGQIIHWVSVVFPWKHLCFFWCFDTVSWVTGKHVAYKVCFFFLNSFLCVKIWANRQLPPLVRTFNDHQCCWWQCQSQHHSLPHHIVALSCLGIFSSHNHQYPCQHGSDMFYLTLKVLFQKKWRKTLSGSQLTQIQLKPIQNGH